MQKKHLCTSILLLAVGSMIADQQTTIPGQQVMVARRTTKPVVIDGVFGPGEWSRAIPVHVTAIRPAEAPGIVSWVGLEGGVNPPDNQHDSSFKVYAMYDADNLYIAVDVADDNIISDNPENPWLDDDVEIFIDGDNQPIDMDAIGYTVNWAPYETPPIPYPPGLFGVLPNNEGFQLVTSAGNVAKVYPSPVIEVDWSSKAGLRPRGFLIETRISLDSINTIDNSWLTDATKAQPDWENDPTKAAGDPTALFSPAFQRPQPGDSIGFNVVVADDDCGLLGDDPWQDSINRTDLVPNPSSYTAWDGSSANWYYADEEAWGTLYLAP
jgi:hypothetical protein